MAVRDFAIVLIDELLKDKELALTDQDIRFYDKGTTAETDENLDDHIRWKNARYFNEESNVVRSSLLIIQMSFENGSEHVSFHMGELYRIYRKGGMKVSAPFQNVIFRRNGMSLFAGWHTCVMQPYTPANLPA